MFFIDDKLYPLNANNCKAGLWMKQSNLSKCIIRRLDNRRKNILLIYKLEESYEADKLNPFGICSNKKIKFR